MGGDWRQEFERARAHQGEDGRPPVFIIVCKNTAIAKVVANDQRPTGIPSSGMPEWLNRDGEVNTIRVDTRVVHDTDRAESSESGSKADEMRWMRHTLDTIGKTGEAVDPRLKGPDVAAVASHLSLYQAVQPCSRLPAHLRVRRHTESHPALNPTIHRRERTTQ
jgi:hypothetical protein